MKTLKDWKWCIDYSNAVGQKDADIAPLFFSSREKAQKHNKATFPKGRVCKVTIREFKSNKAQVKDYFNKRYYDTK